MTERRIQRESVCISSGIHLSVLQKFSWAEATSTRMNPSGYSLRLWITVSLTTWFGETTKKIVRLAATELRKWDMSTISCNLNYLKMDNLSKPEDHCSWVHHSAEDPVSSCGADVVVERTTRFLNWDQRAKAVGVVSRCHLKCFLLQGFTRLAFCNSLGGAFSSLFYFFLVVCTLTMMVSVSRRLVSKYLILEITGLMVVLLENTTSPLKLIPKSVQIVFYLSFSPLCQSAFFPLIKTRIVTCAGNWNWDVTWFNTWIILPLCEIWLR